MARVTKHPTLPLSQRSLLVLILLVLSAHSCEDINFKLPRYNLASIRIHHTYVCMHIRRYVCLSVYTLGHVNILFKFLLTMCPVYCLCEWDVWPFTCILTCVHYIIYIDMGVLYTMHIILYIIMYDVHTYVWYYCA